MSGEPSDYDRLFRDASPEGRAEDTRRGYEQSRVSWLLRSLRLGKYAPRVRERDPLQQEQLTFYGFQRLFDFPLWLCTDAKLSNLAPAPVGRLFGQFLRQPFVSALQRGYDALRDLLGSDELDMKPVGLVFPRPGIPQSLLLYQGDLPEIEQAQAVFRYAPAEAPPYCLLPFQSALQALQAAGYRPTAHLDD